MASSARCSPRRRGRDHTFPCRSRRRGGGGGGRSCARRELRRQFLDYPVAQKKQQHRLHAINVRRNRVFVAVWSAPLDDRGIGALKSTTSRGGRGGRDHGDHHPPSPIPPACPNRENRSRDAGGEASNARQSPRPPPHAPPSPAPVLPAEMVREAVAMGERGIRAKRKGVC